MPSFNFYLTPSFHTPLHFYHLVQTMLAWNTPIPLVLCSEVIFLCNDSWMLSGVPTWWRSHLSSNPWNDFPFLILTLTFKCRFYAYYGLSRTVRTYSSSKETYIFRVLEEYALPLMWPFPRLLKFALQSLWVPSHDSEFLVLNIIVVVSGLCC